MLYNNLKNHKSEGKNPSNHCNFKGFNIFGIYLYIFSTSRTTYLPKVIARDPSAEGTGRKGPSYADETLLPN